MTEYKDFKIEELEQVKEIYTSCGWIAYLRDDEKLKRAFENSLFILGAYEHGRLVGIIRCVGDGEHVVLVQDLAVHADFQMRGIGSALFQSILERYKDVRMFLVITDLEDPVDHHFYQSFGLKRLEERHMSGYVK